MKNKLNKFYSMVFINYSKLFSRKNLYKYMQNSINKISKKDDKIILNIGSGGEIANLLKNNNLNFKEIDIDPKRNPDYVLNIENMYLLKDNSVDIIFCMEVLEHVENPFNAIIEIKRVLKKNGYIIGSTPFLHPIHDEPYDYFRYTKYGILKLFKEFKCVELKERNSYIENVYVILLRLYNIGSNKQKFIAIFLFPFFILLLPFVLILNLIVTNNQATTGYFFVFKK